jgi:hypothetical protein
MRSDDSQPNSARGDEHDSPPTLSIALSSSPFANETKSKRGESDLDPYHSPPPQLALGAGGAGGNGNGSSHGGNGGNGSNGSNGGGSKRNSRNKWPGRPGSDFFSMNKMFSSLSSLGDRPRASEVDCQCLCCACACKRFFSHCWFLFACCGFLLISSLPRIATVLDFTITLIMYLFVVRPAEGGHTSVVHVYIYMCVFKILIGSLLMC